MEIVHSSLCFMWAFSGVFIYPVLFYVSAPYGKLYRQGWGPPVNGNMGWFIQEMISPIFLILSFFIGVNTISSNREDDAAHASVFMLKLPSFPPLFACLLASLWTLHYLHRAILYPCLRSMSPSTLPVVLSAILFNTINGSLAGYELGALSPHLKHPGPGCYAGLSLFLLGAALNVSADNTLRKLRKGNDKSHYTPRGGLFEYVVCPHYLGECIEWSGFALASGTYSGAAFAWWTFANLQPRSLSHLHWYRSKFKEDFPSNRKALIPFLI
mmetsp:Transcript_5349/g.7232  ORF Transcript_5349/g.7232 Transcript_5349/m.7232 type:complete len:270 (+) Transcript_5349:151-960(+)